MTTEMLTAYPVVFSYAELVEGRGFVARVLARGLALMVPDDDEWWMYGVQPGGLAEGGATFEEARLQFRETFRVMLRELGAEQAESAEAAFTLFKNAVEGFFLQTNPTMSKRWHSAVNEVRAARREALDPSINALPRVPAEYNRDAEVSIAVERITPDQAVPRDLLPDLQLADHTEKAA